SGGVPRKEFGAFVPDCPLRAGPKPGAGQERWPAGRTNQGALDARRRWETGVAPLREKLIHVVASVVAIDLAIAGVVIDARSGSASPSSSAAPKAPVTSKGSVLPGLSNGGGILGAAQFR